MLVGRLGSVLNVAFRRILAIVGLPNRISIYLYCVSGNAVTFCRYFVDNIRSRDSYNSTCRVRVPHGAMRPRIHDKNVIVSYLTTI